MNLHQSGKTGYSRGLSPVIGVVMMVVVVVVIAAIVGSYVLNFGTNNAEQEGPVVGTLFSQEYNQTERTYSVTVVMNREANADYAYVMPKTGDSGVTPEISSSAPAKGDYDQDGIVEKIPRNVLVETGDTVTVKGLIEKQRVVIVAVRSGKEHIVQEYTVHPKK